MAVGGRVRRMVPPVRRALMPDVMRVPGSRRIGRMVAPMIVEGGPAGVPVRLGVAPVTRAVTAPVRGGGRVMVPFGRGGARSRLMVARMVRRSRARGRGGLVVMVVCARHGRRGAENDQQ